MSDLVEVRMVTQMSGPRGDGSDWPPVGSTLRVTEAEAYALCHNPNPANPPIAVRVERRKVERAAPEPEAETRPGATEDEPVRAEPAVVPSGEGLPADENLPVEMRRGPGRPPGSKNKPSV